MQTIAETLAHAQAHFQAGRLADAEPLYRHVLKLDPNHYDARLALGSICRRTGSLDEAVEHLRQAARLKPDQAGPPHQLGAALVQQGQIDEAVASLEQAARLATDSAEIATSLRMARGLQAQRRALALARAGKSVEAEVCYRQALDFQPDFVDALLGLGAMLSDQGRYSESVDVCRRVAELAPRAAEVHYNLAIPLVKLNRLDEALASYRRAIELKPDNAEFHIRYALTLLLDAQFAAGWAENEWRWKQTGTQEANPAVRRWNGEPLAGRTIVLSSEQGYGDTLHFVRYAELVKQQGGTVVIEAQPPLAQLLRSCPGVDQVVARGQPLPAYDVVAPLLSLPRILGTTLANIPANVPYLAPDAALTAEWKQRLAAPAAFKIGIAWQGDPTHRADKERSIPVEHFAALTALPGTRIYSLQMGPGREQLLASSVAGAITDLGDQLGDFHNTAAIVRNLDLVITCDSAPAHLAGALGVPVWLALANSPDWRWLLDRDDTLWYPTMRLFRQSQPGDWPEVFQRIRAALVELLAEPRSGGPR